MQDPGIKAVSFSMSPPLAPGGGWYSGLNTLTNHSDKPDLIINVKPADTLRTE